MLDDEFPTHGLPYVDDYDYSSDSDLEVVDELGQPELRVSEPRTGEEDFLLARFASLQWLTPKINDFATATQKRIRFCPISSQKQVMN